VKIVIAAASFASNISGLQRHAFNVTRCLLPQPEIEELHLVVAPWQRALVRRAGLGPDPRLTVHVAEMGPSSLSRNLWYYHRLPELAVELQADLVHLTYPMPVNRRAFRCPTVVTLHDLYPYEIPMNFGFPKFLFNRAVLQQCLRSADAIACVSQITATRLKQYAPTSVCQKALRIYNCVEPESVAAAHSPICSLQDEPFLLCIAQHRRNKNITMLIRTFDRLLHSGQIDSKMQLAVVGIGGPETENIHQLISSSGLTHKVHLLEGLSEPELQWCYRHCEMLVAPSITEGFGLPVAEGLLAGCRIVCSDIPAHREVGDGHCRFVPLREDAEDKLAAAIVSALHDPKPQPMLLPKLSAPVLAKEYVELYRNLTTATVPVQNVRVAGPINIVASERQSL
jgi:glycosyltransferase involved in cell wall biosynthesis